MREKAGPLLQDIDLEKAELGVAHETVQVDLQLKLVGSAVAAQEESVLGNYF